MRCRKVVYMLEIELAAGTIEYEDTGGSGPTIASFSPSRSETVAAGRRSLHLTT
jgi:hypothetical protein